MDWAAEDGGLASVVDEQTAACLAVYREDPSRVEQDANIELRIAEGGYRDRQLYELLQNAVDAAARENGARIEVHLTADALYVANDGAPFDAGGVRAIMASDLSAKDDDRIGRFGIGFKSVLAVSAEPRILSRTVSLVFDRAWAEQTIRAAGHESPRYPTMRLARAVDPVRLGAGDAVLRELMSWASTVVHLPLVGQHDRLAKELRLFPAQFVLFSPHVTTVTLVDARAAGTPTRRTIQRRPAPSGDVVVAEGERETRWTVLSAEHQLGEDVRREAGRLAGRESVRVSWAVSRPPSQGLGAFWAYFPTNTGTTLAGIVNAPWQLSDDRTNLLESRLNRELIEKRLPELLAHNVERLHDPASPGSLLDVLPARGREQRSWADGVVNEPIFTRLRQVSSLPDWHGTLRRPSVLKVQPDEVLESWQESWATAPGLSLSEWVHPETLTTPERRSKVRRLVQAKDDGGPTLTEWLAATTVAGTVDASETAVKLAARMLSDTRHDSSAAKVRSAVLDARILRLEDGSFVRPSRGRVFVRASAEDDGRAFVDADLAAQPGVKEALQELGVTVLDERGDLQRLLVSARDSDKGWEQIWRRARTVSLEVAQEVFAAELPEPYPSVVRVRTAAGAWSTVAKTFLAGRIIPADRSRDAQFLVDPLFHAQDVELLRFLGAVSEPVWRARSPFESWRAGYEQAVKEHYVNEKKGSKPDPRYVVAEGAAPAWPLEPLAGLSPAGKAELTTAVLARGLPDGWTVRHSTNRSYGTTKVLAPELWHLRRHGFVPTSFGPVRPHRAVQPHDAYPNEVMPVVEMGPEAARKLGVRETPDDFDVADWKALKAVADTWPDDDRRAEFYTWLPGHLDDVERLVVRVGSKRESVQRSNIGVTSDDDVYAALLDAQVPALLVGTEEDEDLLLDFGLSRGKDLLRQEVVAEPSAEPEPLLEAFRPLSLYLEPEDHDVALQPCSRLARLVATPEGQVERRVAAMRDGSRVLVTATKPEALLRQVSDAMGLRLAAADIASVLEAMAKSQATALRRRVRAAAGTDLDQALVEAVGADELRKNLPKQALEALASRGGEPTERGLAALARAVHGIGILRQYRAVLELKGLEPPRDFTGRQEARRFVTELGFPPEWAGFPSRPRPSSEAVDGRIELNPLHDYQLFVTDRIKSLLAGIGPERGVVSLPTGAGKTRVAVQALVEQIRDGRLTGPLVWIAQSDELCEQAAETWSYVWRAIGPPVPLLIGRLWGSNQVAEEPGAVQLVVATDDKLDAIVKRGDGTGYEWLREPSVVVVDEAHTSISAQYTRVLEWLGRGRRRDGKPLIGLTATPYRGTSDTETERLAARYDKNRLDRGAFLKEDPYAELQDMGVLAHVEHRSLDGVDVDFTSAELAQIEQTNRFPSTKEEQLGASVERNLKIVDSIADLPDDWTVLLFAPSVVNARAIAALLSHRGIPSVAISSDTETAARRHYIDEFRAGRIRVITNYSVLTQGFDAPAVRAVYVTRPTFSPNVYQQMVGRGLRGPRNGGSEEVVIVNVEDNYNKYGERLAFRDFDKLWRR